MARRASASRGLLLAWLLLGLIFAAGCGSGGDTQAEQVARGQQVFVDECERCHQPGGTAPELTASRLASYGTAQALFNYISRAMPQDDPGSLTEQQYWDVTAHLLDRNGLLPQETVLGPETADEVTLTQ